MLDWLFGRKKEEPKPEEQQQKKKQKSKAEQETEDKWQYEFLLQFLNSPLWRVSILDFVDQYCIVFDNQEQNKFEYTKIHNQFKELVGNLFDGMMQQIGLDEDKLVQLLERGFQSRQKKLFNQLLLCDDFLKFKQLMVKRNKALQSQALKAISGEQRKNTSNLQKQRSIVHSSLKQQQARRKKLQQQQEQVLRKVLEMSMRQAQERKQIERLEQRAVEIQGSKVKKMQQQKRKQQQTLKKEAQAKQARQRQAKQQQQREKARLQQQRQQREQQEIKRKNQQKKRQLKAKMEKKKNQQAADNQKPLGDLPPLKANIKKQPQPVIQVKKQQPKEQIKPLQTHQQQQKEDQKAQSSEDRKKRLMEQRQKIRKKKQQQRKKMLEQEEGAAKKTMNIVLQDSGIHDSTHPQTEMTAEQKVSKDQIQRRKQIMKKIKNRIVQDF